MKKILMLVIAASFTAGIFAAAEARERKSVSSAPQESSTKRDDMKKKIEEKKKDLNDSEWKVTLTSGGKAEGDDVLTFRNGTVASKAFAKRGYPSSNYTLSIPEGSDMAVWETMQTDTKGAVIFIRGEWKDKTMRGVISEQLEKGKTKDYNFSSSEKTELKAEEAPIATAVAPVEVAPVAPKSTKN